MGAQVSAGRAVGTLLGVAADVVLGEPRHAHPASAFVGTSEAVRRRLDRDDVAAGAVHTGTLVGAAVLAGLGVERLGRHSPMLRVLGTAATTWVVLGGAGMAADGTELARNLETGDLAAARSRLAELDPRCTQALDVPALSTASVEVVATGTAGAVVTPLLCGAVAGAPGLLGARAVQLLRHRVGPHVPGCHRFGQAVARLDDVVSLLPARLGAALTVAAAPVVGGSAGGAWQAWQRDTSGHPHPNVGRVQAAFAGALDVRLGGRTVYPRGVRELPVVGNGRNPDAGHVTRSVELSRVVGWLAGAAATVLGGLLGRRARMPARTAAAG